MAKHHFLVGIPRFNDSSLFTHQVSTASTLTRGKNQVDEVRTRGHVKDGMGPMEEGVPFYCQLFTSITTLGLAWLRINHHATGLAAPGFGHGHCAEQASD